MQKQNSKKHGFTLAEILITLTVIGVVAALTIPTLLQNTNQAELKTALKRDFADLSQATLSIKNDLGGSLVNAFPGEGLGSDALKNAYRGKLNYIKECGGTGSWGTSGNGASADGCWHAADGWQYLNGTKFSGTMTTPGLILNNGTLMYLYITSSSCSTLVGDYYRCGEITFDVNGFKKPNTVGKDIFVAVITNDGILPMGARGYNDPDTSINGCYSTAYGYGCAAKYLYE